jgi:hypothetical protein
LHAVRRFARQIAGFVSQASLSQAIRALC